MKNNNIAIDTAESVEKELTEIWNFVQNIGAFQAKLARRITALENNMDNLKEWLELKVFED